MQWHEGITRPVALAELGQRYRRYRLADPEAEEAMAGSLRRWGQLSPVVACVREGQSGTARRLQALVGGAANGRDAELERACAWRWMSRRRRRRSWVESGSASSA